MTAQRSIDRPKHVGPQRSLLKCKHTFTYVNNSYLMNRFHILIEGDTTEDGRKVCGAIKHRAEDWNGGNRQRIERSTDLCPA